MKKPFIKTDLSHLARSSILLFLFILISFLVLSICSCRGSDTYTLDDNDKTVELARGDSLTLKLESNPTTGYGWQLTEDMDESVVSLTDTGFKQSKQDQEMVGSGGYEYFYFRAVSTGSTDIILNYARPWEEGVEPIDVFKLSVMVK